MIDHDQSALSPKRPPHNHRQRRHSDSRTSSSAAGRVRGHKRSISSGTGTGAQQPADGPARRPSDSKLLTSIRKKRRQSAIIASKHRGVKAWRRDDDLSHLAGLRRLEQTLLEADLHVEGGAAGDEDEASPEHSLAKIPSAEIHVNSSYPEKGVEMTSMHSLKNPMRELTRQDSAVANKNGTAAKERPTYTTERGRGLDRFRQAVRRVKMQNTLQRSFDSTRYSIGNEKHQSSHVYSWCSGLKVVFHIIGLLLNLWLAESLWTYDGLDTVEMVEDQILRGTRYDHFHSEYRDVDSHPSFTEVSGETLPPLPPPRCSVALRFICLLLTVHGYASHSHDFPAQAVFAHPCPAPDGQTRGAPDPPVQKGPEGRGGLRQAWVPQHEFSHGSAGRWTKRQRNRGPFALV